AAGIVIISLVYFSREVWKISPVDIQKFILSFGWFSPAVFILIYTIGPFVFFPSFILSMTAGLTYGIWPGAVFIWLGALGAASTGYLIGRFLGRKILKIHNFSWSEKMEEKITERGFLFVLVLRLIPVIGFGMLSYLSGVMNVRFHHYIVATMIGILPGIFVYGTLGSSLTSGSRMVMLSAFLLLAAVSGVIFIFRGRVKQWVGIE
ncbi:MAG: TVP38/TMEM64 family protein, partial [Alkalicoccus sp.]